MFKFFYVMGKALSGELSCLCDRSCSIFLRKNIHCDPSLEQSCGNYSNEKSKLRVSLTNKQNYLGIVLRTHFSGAFVQRIIIQY